MPTIKHWWELPCWKATLSVCTTLSAMGRPVAEGGLAVESTGGQGVGGTPGAASGTNQH